MPHYCRVQGTHCTLSYSMGNEDEKDEYEAEALLKVGFTSIDWEDHGGHGTIFDDFHTLEHFTQGAKCNRSLPRYFQMGMTRLVNW